MSAQLDPADRFIAKVETGPGCWIWTGAKSGGRYGAFLLHGRSTYAHRFAYELHNGPIPAGMYVMHACDNPLCVNPAHLSLGTARENITDAIRKGRRPACYAKTVDRGAATKPRACRPRKELDLRHRAVLALYSYGMTFDEIGQLLGVSKQRAHQMHLEATVRRRGGETGEAA